MNEDQWIYELQCCIYIYVCIYIYICTYIYIHCWSIYVYVYIYIYLCVFLYIHTFSSDIWKVHETSFPPCITCLHFPWRNSQLRWFWRHPCAWWSLDFFWILGLLNSHGFPMVGMVINRIVRGLKNPLQGFPNRTSLDPGTYEPGNRW